jgi:hypothetical protein
MTDKEMKQVEQYTKPYAIVPVDMETTGLLVNALRAALAQPERKWQGLTAYEMQELHLANADWGNFGCAIEAKLKEKNT